MARLSLGPHTLFSASIRAVVLRTHTRTHAHTNTRPSKHDACVCVCVRNCVCVHSTDIAVLRRPYPRIAGRWRANRIALFAHKARTSSKRPCAFVCVYVRAVPFTLLRARAARACFPAALSRRAICKRLLRRCGLIKIGQCMYTRTKHCCGFDCTVRPFVRNYIQPVPPHRETPNLTVSCLRASAVLSGKSLARVRAPVREPAHRCDTRTRSGRVCRPNGALSVGGKLVADARDTRRQATTTDTNSPTQSLPANPDRSVKRQRRADDTCASKQRSAHVPDKFCVIAVHVLF